MAGFFNSNPYVKGVIPTYKKIVDDVLPKYKNISFGEFKPYIKTIDAIEAFYADLTNSDNIDALVESNKKTLNYIFENLINYILSVSTDAIGFTDAKGFTGGATIPSYRRAKSLSEQISSQIIDRNLFNKTSDIKNLDANFSSLTITPELSKTQMEEIYNTADQYMEHLNKLPDNNSVTNFITPHTKSTIKQYFSDYFDDCVKSYDDIRLNNTIILTKDYITSDAIRPLNLIILVTELADAFANSWDDTEQQKNIKLCVYSIIQWYLLHNETRGIDLKSYDIMQRIIPPYDGFHKDFINELNLYLY